MNPHRRRRLRLSSANPQETEAPLTPQRAFVVQFREEMDATPRWFHGRVEHVVSGHATRFHSSEELIAFFSRILADLKTTDD